MVSRFPVHPAAPNPRLMAPPRPPPAFHTPRGGCRPMRSGVTVAATRPHPRRRAAGGPDPRSRPVVPGRPRGTPDGTRPRRPRSPATTPHRGRSRSRPARRTHGITAGHHTTPDGGGGAPGGARRPRVSRTPDKPGGAGTKRPRPGTGTGGWAVAGTIAAGPEPAVQPGRAPLRGPAVRFRRFRRRSGASGRITFTETPPMHPEPTMCPPLRGSCSRVAQNLHRR